ncbi:helix-turn-helix domain-containing protein [Solibacillus sp. FSL W7-1436]|uniref:helix-turn-helix domain-containing protein n=1 Tax=Solibacillus sp. FSL W7-1436 TaxID=2921705 RepID=UPI0030FC9404
MISEVKQDLVDLVEKMIVVTLQKEKKEKEWMNLGEAANYLGVSRNTLNKLIANQDIELYAVEGIKRVSRTQIDEFLKSKIIKRV